jgi:Galactose binding lectin domain
MECFVMISLYSPQFTFHHCHSPRLPHVGCTARNTVTIIAIITNYHHRHNCMFLFRAYCYGIAENGHDFCLHESFNASCRHGSVILMTSAAYGRMRLGRCINGDFNIGCSKDVVTYMDAQCTARSACEVSVRNLVDIHPCQRDFMSYLEASYKCIEGKTFMVEYS